MPVRVTNAAVVEDMVVWLGDEDEVAGKEDSIGIVAVYKVG